MSTLRDLSDYEEQPVKFKNNKKFSYGNYNYDHGYGSSYGQYDNYSYGSSKSYGYGGNSWRGDKGDIKSWASQFSYKKPDYQKIKEELLKKQKELNSQGYSIKIGYGTPSITRKQHGFVRCSVNSTEEFEFVKEFIDKTKDMGYITLGDVDTKILQSMLGVSSSWEVKYNGVPLASGSKSILTDADEYQAVFDGYVPREKKKDLEKEDKGTTWGGDSSFNLRKLDKATVEKIAEQIRNKIKIKTNRFIKEDSMRSGNRINRSFVNGMSYKPLVRKYEEVRRKKKALCILDSSGSMGGDMHKNARNFMEGIKATGLFDTKAYYSSSYCMYKSDGEEYLVASGGEGFCQLLSRLDVMNDDFNDYDYVFFFTDLEIGSAEVDEVNTICKGKKHILINFGGEYAEESYSSQFPDLKIKTTQDVQVMVETLINYV